jgi:outer membrane protein OmpA-like peptidoglycan-associated protein
LNAFNHHQYRCVSCNHELTIPLPACEICGPGATGIFTFDEKTRKVKLVCQKCFQPQLSGNTPPANCPTCITGYCDWWDNQRNTWLELNLTPQTLVGDEFWVTGDFDGDYEADLAPEHKKANASPTHQSLFHVDIKHSYLKNVRKVNGPPLEVSQQEKRPFTFSLIAPVDIEVNSSNGESSINRVALKDFRLHDWTLVATLTSSEHGSDRRFGRIKGTAYGVITENIEKTVPTPKKSFWPKKTTQPIVEETNIDEAPSELDDATLSATEEIAQNNIVIKPDDCITCNFFVQLIAFSLIWLGCNFKVALLFGIFLSIVCWASEKLIENNLTIQKPWLRLSTSLVLLLGALGSLTIGYWPRFVSDCVTLSQYAIITCAAALLLSSLVRYCFVRFIVFICLFFALSSWCKINNRECKFTEPTNLAAISVQSLIQQYQILTDNDVASEILNDNSVNNPNGRYLSINEAASNPGLLKDCKNKVYIPFDFDKDQLDDSTRIKLDRLGEIMRGFRDSRVIISGFSSLDPGDSTPDGNLRNIALSQRRTEAIRDYLVNNDYINSEKIEIRAYGSNVPILKDKPASELNRRVEVNLQCKAP